MRWMTCGKTSDGARIYAAPGRDGRMWSVKREPANRPSCAWILKLNGVYYAAAATRASAYVSAEAAEFRLTDGTRAGAGKA